MGREVRCLCTYSGAVYSIKALLETEEIIIRGELRRRIQRSTISAMVVVGDYLEITSKGDIVRLELGETEAQKWRDALTKVRPSLAQKLGIHAALSVQMFGSVDDDKLLAALQSAAKVSLEPGDLIIALVHAKTDLEAVLQQSTAQLDAKVPVWIVYPKGADTALGEETVRTTARSKGLIDTKVAAVSATLTALRFVKRT